jgi:hypothetical protein
MRSLLAVVSSMLLVVGCSSTGPRYDAYFMTTRTGANVMFSPESLAIHFGRLCAGSRPG